MWLIISILSLLLISYIRIRFISNSFSDNKTKVKKSITIIIFSIIIVSALFYYKNILNFLNLEDLYFLKSITYKTIISFILYCLSFIIILNSFFKWLKNKKNINLAIIGTLLIASIWLAWNILWINILIMSYIISVYWEEILKFSLGQNLSLKNNKTLIFFAILSWFGFSLIENIFYIINQYMVNSDQIFKLTLSRWIFTTLIHVVATGTIALLISRKQKNSIAWIVIWLLWWLLIHGLYNLSLAYNSTIFTIIIIVACYIILTNLLFKSDIVYKKN